MTRQQYVEINGTKHYLNDEGDLTNGVGNVLIRGRAIATLGLKVETEGPRFEDIEPGAYQVKLESETGRTLRKSEGGEWVAWGGYLVSKETVARWHNEGILHRLRVDEEATNA